MPTKALAFSSDVTPRYCEADPYEGGKQAVAECWRNLTATGADAAGRHRQPQFRQSRAARDHGPVRRAPSKASATPAARSTSRSSRATSRSTTRPTASGILPTPDHRRRRPDRRLVEDGAHRLCRRRRGDPARRRARTSGARISASRSTCATSTAARDGPPPPVDLAHEKRVGDFVRTLIRDGIATAVHDLSDGGLAVALAEMAMASGIGATVNQLDGADPIPAVLRRGPGPLSRHRRSTRRRRACEALADEAKALGIFAPWIGTTGGKRIETRRGAGRSRSTS